MPTIVTSVVFPLSCYTPADEELWENNPYEYIRVKFGKSMQKNSTEFQMYPIVMAN